MITETANDVLTEQRGCNYYGTPILSDLYFSYGLDIGVESSFMSAIIYLFTREGFVIAADGLRKNPHTGSIVCSEAQKIYKFMKGNTALAYGITGVSEIVGANGEVALSLVDECRRAMDHLTNARLPVAFDVFVKTAAGIVNKELAQAKESGKLHEYPSVPDEPGLIARLYVIGFYEGIASTAQAEFRHEAQNLYEPFLVKLSMVHGDLRQLGGSGSDVIVNRVLKTPAPDMEKYRTPSIRSADISKRELPNTVEEAAHLVENCIQACIDNPHLDQGQCDFIGGRIRVAKITKRCGFEWIKP